ncbi:MULTISPECIES: STAS domain-containing protein [unclassified Mycobacterium]|uniref:STAS domain-containing protein n=1 Tax=unclassified Mycobacterium TaxID=2642494 RepID=UPI000FBB641E|nr:MULTISPECIES: STAS domain-containing protein [unclassified Mycobacterium]MDP7703610.1 STAS domain-containing protein [Mycobacterium sp. TY815]MDP7722092.1 STAS domain-containing protein [Mycobacterium sp. TY814]RUP06436.1 MAG: anti-sigma factor antagonist [Mycobacterium sp.]
MSVTQTWLKCENAEFNAQWEQGSGMVSACGELDAANADLLAEYVARCVKHCRWLTLDLTGLKFIGTAGFSALHRINVVCSGADVRWAIVPSLAVARLLRICDPDGVLPTAGPKQPAQARLLQLIPESS